jgi:hypothetical protein
LIIRLRGFRLDNIRPACNGCRSGENKVQEKLRKRTRLLACNLLELVPIADDLNVTPRLIDKFF